MSYDLRIVEILVHTYWCLVTFERIEIFLITAHTIILSLFVT